MAGGTRLQSASLLACCSKLTSPRGGWQRKRQPLAKVDNQINWWLQECVQRRSTSRRGASNCNSCPPASLLVCFAGRATICFARRPHLICILWTVEFHIMLAGAIASQFHQQHQHHKALAYASNTRHNFLLCRFAFWRPKACKGCH